MKLLEDRISAQGRILEGDILDVDMFLNHQLDIALLTSLGREFHNRFGKNGIDKILTIESSGIGIATITSTYFGSVPVVFAKKSLSKNICVPVYTAPVVSYTHGTTHNIIVSSEAIKKGDRVLIIDDYLAKGNALKGLFKICEQAEAEIIGAGIVIEKVYQQGGNELRSQGYWIESLAKIASLSTENGIVFEN